MQWDFGVKNLVLKKKKKNTPRLWKEWPGILIQCRLQIYALFKNPKILTRKSRAWVFDLKNMVLMKYPKISTGAKPKILIRCTLLKSRDFDKTRRLWVFGVKNVVLKKYPKISTGAKPKILIRCKPNIFVLIKSTKILTRHAGYHGYLASKHGSYEIPPDFDRCFTWNFDTM